MAGVYWAVALTCQPHRLGTHPERQEPEQPLSKQRIRVQKGTFGEGWVLTTLAKALELPMVLLQPLPFLGLPWDAEQQGRCEVSQALTLNTHTAWMACAPDKGEKTPPWEKTQGLSLCHPSSLLTPDCNLPAPWVGGSQLPSLGHRASRDLFCRAEQLSLQAMSSSRFPIDCVGFKGKTSWFLLSPSGGSQDKIPGMWHTLGHPSSLLSLNIFLHCAVKKKIMQMPLLWLWVSEVFLDQTQIFKFLLSDIQRNPEGFLLGERRELKSGLTS